MYQISLEVPETHRNISRPFGRYWHTFEQSASTQNSAKLGKLIWEQEVNISASIRAPYTKFCLEVSQTYRNISRLPGRCWPTYGQSAGAQNPGQVEQIHGGVGWSISQLLLGPLAPNFLEVPETHRNISTQPTGCLHTCWWAKIHPKHPHYLQAIFTWFKASQHQFLSYTDNRIIHNAVYIDILNGTHLWEVYLVQNVCYPVKHPSCQPFALTVDWMPAKCSIRLADAVSQKKKLVHGTRLAAGMFAPTHNGCRHLQPWWLSRSISRSIQFGLCENTYLLRPSNGNFSVRSQISSRTLCWLVTCFLCFLNYIVRNIPLKLFDWFGLRSNAVYKIDSWRLCACLYHFL